MKESSPSSIFNKNEIKSVKNFSVIQARKCVLVICELYCVYRFTRLGILSRTWPSKLNKVMKFGAFILAKPGLEFLQGYQLVKFKS
jgi:hypothetical protein